MSRRTLVIAIVAALTGLIARGARAQDPGSLSATQTAFACSLALGSVVRGLMQEFGARFFPHTKALQGAIRAASAMTSSSS